MKKFNNISYLNEFNKDFKKLLKRFKTLKEDFKIFIDTQLYLYHKLKLDNKGIFQLANLGITYPKIYKARKFACRSLKGTGSQSGIRITYAYFNDTDTIEFIEIYYKGDKKKEDRNRIIKYCRNK